MVLFGIVTYIFRCVVNLFEWVDSLFEEFILFFVIFVEKSLFTFDSDVGGTYGAILSLLLSFFYGEWDLLLLC